jgi:hypothetical protein
MASDWMGEPLNLLSIKKISPDPQSSIQWFTDPLNLVDCLGIGKEIESLI